MSTVARFHSPITDPNGAVRRPGPTCFFIIQIISEHLVVDGHDRAAEALITRIPSSHFYLKFWMKRRSDNQRRSAR
jgi:hypothetical protein